MPGEALPIELDVAALQAMRTQRTPHWLLDCREPEEYAIARIEGSTLIPMGELPQRLGELEPRRGEHIVVHCHHGGRSLRVVQWLRQQGFPRVQNLTGGIDAWSQRIDPHVPRY